MVIETRQKIREFIISIKIDISYIEGWVGKLLSNLDDSGL